MRLFPAISKGSPRECGDDEDKKMVKAREGGSA
jgi:hypothetical protein